MSGTYTPEAPFFRIIGGDGNQYGPVDLATLQQWAREGRIAAQTQVWDSRTGGWQPARQVFELGGVFHAAPAGVPPMPGGTRMPAYPPAPGFPQMPEAPAGPPPGVELAAQILERGHRVAIGDWVSEGFEFYKANFGLAMGASLIFLGLAMGAGMLGQIPFLGILVQLGFSYVIQPVLMGGLWYVLLQQRRGRQVTAGDIFIGFSQFFGQAVLANLIMALIMLAAAVPGGVLMGVGAVMLFGKGAAGAAGVALMVVGGVLMAVPIFYLSVCYQYALPLVADRRMEFWAALETSRRVVSRQWFMFFLLGIVTGLIAMVGVLACCVGVVFTIPLGFCIMAVAYDHIFGPAGEAAPAGK